MEASHNSSSSSSQSDDGIKCCQKVTLSKQVKLLDVGSAVRREVDEMDSI